MITLEDIVAMCKCQVSMDIDSYTADYITFGEALRRLKSHISPDTYQEMKKFGHIVELQAYPQTPIGSHCVYAGTPQLAIARMYELLTESEDE